MKQLLALLKIISIAADASKPFTPGTGVLQIDDYASALAKIALIASDAYTEAVGEPLDLSKIQPIDPVV